MTQNHDDLEGRLTAMFENQAAALPDASGDPVGPDYTPTPVKSVARRRSPVLALVAIPVFVALVVTLALNRPRSAVETKSGSRFTLSSDSRPAPTPTTERTLTTISPEQAAKFCAKPNDLGHAVGPPGPGGTFNVGDSSTIQLFSTNGRFRGSDPHGPVYQCPDHHYVFGYTVQGPPIVAVTPRPGRDPDGRGFQELLLDALSPGKTTIHATAKDPDTGAVLATVDYAVTVEP